MIRKLQIKFVAINMVMITIVLCAMFGLVYHSTRTNLETESIGMMKDIASDPFRLGRPDATSPELRLPYFTIQIGSRGELIATGGGYYDLSDLDFLMQVINEALGSGQDTGVVEAYALRFCRVSTAKGMVLVFADMSSERSTLENLVKISLAIGLLSFLVFLGISIFLSHRAVKPVEAAWLQQRQFVADASHELKTPLTVIMTNAEMLQSEGFEAEERAQFMHNILIMSSQMKSLVENMLELARSDAGLIRRQMQTVDWSKVVLDEAISFEGVFVEKGMTIDANIEPAIMVCGQEQALRQVVGILLDNAQKYAVPAGNTIVQLHSLGQNRCRLSVSNPGAPIPQEELTNIFRRFYRMDKARSRDGSFGLGLSIADSIIAQHKGKIWAESENGLNTFFVELHKKQ